MKMQTTKSETEGGAGWSGVDVDRDRAVVVVADPVLPRVHANMTSTPHVTETIFDTRVSVPPRRSIRWPA